jgi:hypothetical protein
MAAIEDWYSNNPNVVIITNLDDIGQPYSCQQWGDHHLDFNEDVIPLMTDDGNQDVIWGWLQSGSAFPSTAYIDHNMTVFHKANNPSFGTAISIIDNMVDECGDLCTLSPPESLFEYSVSENTVSFFDLSDLASEGWIISDWSWNFGDGNISNEQNPIHTYISDGTYTVSLFIETDIGIESSVYSEDIQIGTLNVNNQGFPNEMSLKQNYPNPFNPTTTIDYYLSSPGSIAIKIYDIHGKLVSDLLNENKQAGNHSIKWSPANISSGLYFVKLLQNNSSSQIKVMYSK